MENHYYTLINGSHLHFNIRTLNRDRVKESLEEMQKNITKTLTRQVGISFSYDITKKTIDDLLRLISRNTRIRRISISLAEADPHEEFEQQTVELKLEKSFIAKNVPMIKRCLLLNTQLAELELNYCYLTRDTWTGLVSMINAHCPLLTKLWIMEDCHPIGLVEDVTRLIMKNKSITRLTCYPKSSLTPADLDIDVIRQIGYNVYDNKTLQNFSMGMGTPTIKQLIERGQPPLTTLCANIIKMAHEETLNGEYELRYNVNKNINVFTTAAVKGATKLTFAQIGTIAATDKKSIMSHIRRMAKDVSDDRVSITAAEVCANCKTLVFQDMLTLSQWAPFDVITSCVNLKSLRLFNCKLDELDPDKEDRQVKHNEYSN